MAVISFGMDMSRRNVGLLVLLIAFTMSSLRPVDCAMTAEESMLKMLSAEFVLRLTVKTMANAHIRASIEQAYLDAQLKYKALVKVSSSLYGMDAHDLIPSPHERTVREMDEALGRLPPLASLDPFLAQMLDKLLGCIKPVNKLRFKEAALGLELFKNSDNQQARATLADYKKRSEAIQETLVVLGEALTDYSNKWKETQVRPKQQDQKPVLDAVDGRIKAVKEHVAVLFDEKEISSTEKSYFRLKVSGVIAALAIIILLGALWFILVEKRGLARPSKRASPRTTTTKTDSSP